MSVVKDNVCSSSLKRFWWISKWYWLAWNPRRCWHLFSLGGEWWMPGLASKHKGHCYERAAREKAVAGGWCPRRLGLHRFYQRMLRCSHCNSLMEKNWRAQLELEEVVVPVPYCSGGLITSNWRDYWNSHTVKKRFSFLIYRSRGRQVEVGCCFCSSQWRMMLGLWCILFWLIVFDEATDTTLVWDLLASSRGRCVLFCWIIGNNEDGYGEMVI